MLIYLLLALTLDEKRVGVILHAVHTYTNLRKMSDLIKAEAELKAT